MSLAFVSALRAPQDDSELIRRLKKHDSEAMGDLYDRFGKLVYAVVVRIVRDPPVAEDLVQETFLKIWNCVAAFDHERGAFGPWVLTIARNHAIDYCRSTEGRLSQARCNLERLERPGLFVGFGADFADRSRARFVRQAFDRLSDNQRRVLDLAYFEGLSQAEIAARLRHPPGTVNAWAYSALQTLREELKQAGRGLHLP